jgi:high-affinity Fe2+/Pb2+ permease
VRSNFKGRGKGNWISNMLEMAGSLCWGLLGGMLAAADAAPASDILVVGAGAALAGALIVLLAAWLLRDRQGHAP